MKHFHTVEVSDEQYPLFPEGCIICRKPLDVSFDCLEMHDVFGRKHSSIITFFNAPGTAGELHTLKAPAHRECLKSITLKFRTRNLLPILVGTPVLITGMSGVWNNYLILLIGIAAAAPLVIWDIAHPLPLEYEHLPGKHIFRFRDRTYADDFAVHNKTSTKKCV